MKNRLLILSAIGLIGAFIGVAQAIPAPPSGAEYWILYKAPCSAGDAALGDTFCVALHGSYTPPNPPTLQPGAGWGGTATPQPAKQGATTGCGNSVPQCGFNDNAIAAWDEVQYQSLAGSFKLCVIAFHNQGIAGVTIAVDGGVFIPAISTTSEKASPQQEWCAVGVDTDFADGPHEARAIVLPNYGAPRVLQSVRTATLDTAGVFTSQAHGLIGGKPVLISGDPTNFNPATIYYICGTTVLTANTFKVGTGSGFSTNVGCTSPVSSTTASTVSISFPNARGNNNGWNLETLLINSESLYFSTNATSKMLVKTAYANSATGSGSTCSSGSPCLDIHTARESMVKTVAITSFGATSCTVLTRTGHGLTEGEGVEATGTTFGGSLLSLTLYWVHRIDANTLSLYALPGQSSTCVNAVGSSGITLTSDLGGDIINLQCPNSPTNYSWGNASESFYRRAFQQYLTIQGNAGCTAANVKINALGGTPTQGLRTDMIHATNLNWDFSVNNTCSGCASASWSLMPMGSGYAMWFDNTASKGTGHANLAVNQGAPYAGLTVWLGGIFWNNGAITEWAAGNQSVTLSRNVSIDSSADPWNDAQTVINGVGTNIGIDQNDPLTTTGTCSAGGPNCSGQTVLAFSTALPALLANNWLVFGPACVTAGSLVSSFNTGAKTITLNTNLAGSCASGTVVSVGTGDHPDYWFLRVTPHVNYILYGSSGANIHAEAVFNQGGSGTYNFSDTAVVNNNLAVVNVNGYGGFSNLALQSPTINWYFWGNTLASDAANNLTGPFTDTVWRDNTCTAPWSPTIVGKSGITSVGTNTGC